MKITRNIYLKCRRICRTVWEFLKYDVWHFGIKDNYYNAWWFFHNLKVFWKTLWEWRPWDYSYINNAHIMMLEQLANQIKDGTEEERSAYLKYCAIQSLISELKRDVEDEAWEIKEQKDLSNEEYDKLYDSMMDEHFKKIFRLMRGQDGDTIDALLQPLRDEFKKTHGREPNMNESYDMWASVFDGTGVGGWWE